MVGFGVVAEIQSTVSPEKVDMDGFKWCDGDASLSWLGLVYLSISR
jgi:hypothetical protein